MSFEQPAGISSNQPPNFERFERFERMTGEGQIGRFGSNFRSQGQFLGFWVVLGSFGVLGLLGIRGIRGVRKLQRTIPHEVRDVVVGIS